MYIYLGVFEKKSLAFSFVSDKFPKLFWTNYFLWSRCEYTRCIFMWIWVV